MKNIDEQISIIKRGCVELISEAELRAKLLKGKTLRVKAGFDPTAPDLHLGHTVLMHKLKQFQDLGHEVIFLIGDFTAKIGDPTGRSATRPPLTDQEIKINVATYTEQAFQILDKNKTKVVFNSAWLAKMNAAEMIQLAAQYNVARMLEREDFKNRFQSGQSIGGHEFLYPLLQAQDSVELQADVEIGGTDQKFNLLMGRTLQERAGIASQVVLTMPLLVGLDGEKKMSKSYGNHIGIRESAQEMFGKIMSISDELMWDYFTLLSALSESEISKLKHGHPKEAKIALALEVITRFHSKDAASSAANEFTEVFSNKGKPEIIDETQLSFRSEGYQLVDLLNQFGLVKSKGEGRRLILQNGIKLNDETVKDTELTIVEVGQYDIQVGKRRFHKLIIGEK